LQKLLSLAAEAAILAGAEIMKVYDKDFGVFYKEDNSPLTIADELANGIITNKLKETNMPIISEENKNESFIRRKTWSLCWMVDPLDGTKEFIKRNGEFTVNIALIEQGKPVLGVIYAPAVKELYYTLVSNNKSYKHILNRHEFCDEIFLKSSEIRPLQDNTKKTIKIVGSRSHKSVETNTYIENLKKQGYKVSFVSKGSSLKFCMVAEGKAHIYPRFAPTMEWDTAAGHAICNAVGLEVIKTDMEEELEYNKENLLNPYFIVK